ncbi:MAG: DUF3854 domain-containing protein [Anaerolineales bacterium]|nr:DUF3854 domain-containing protein [Anaerolineales bacterium]
MTVDRPPNKSPVAVAEALAKLSPEHLAMLRDGSGIAEHVIAARGYRTVTSKNELTELGFAPKQAGTVPGLLLPLHTPDGANGVYAFRPDKPRTIQEKNETKILKYEIPKHSSARLDCPPVCRHQIGNPTVPLWITEGQKKADALASRGLCAIALLGVWNFKGKNEFGGVTILSDFDLIAFNGRQVRIVFDSDVMLKPSVRLALNRLQALLERRKAVVTAVYLPNGEDGHKLGVDDYFVAGKTVNDLESLIEGPRPAPKAAPPVWELLEEAPPAMSRPLLLLKGRAYAAAWLYTRITVSQIIDKTGAVTYLQTPTVTNERKLFVLRDDGLTFGDGPGDDSYKPLREMGAEAKLSEVPSSDKLWSTRGVKAYQGGQRPSPASVFQRVQDVVNRFMDFDMSIAAQGTLAEMIACYILATWFLDAFTVIGYLWPNGDKGTGKTKLLALIAQLGHLGLHVLGGGSYASLRDLADMGATLCFDDCEDFADPKKTDPDKRTLLLAGNRRGTYVPFKEPSPDKTWRTRYVHTFCPRVFSATQIPDPILESRTIVIPLVKSPDSSKANADVLDLELWPHPRQPLIDDLWALALANLPAVERHARTTGTRAILVGRDLEPWRAILAVASWLDECGVSGVLARMEHLALNYQTERPEMARADLLVLTLKALRKLTATATAAETTLSTSEITEEVKTIVEGEETDIDLTTITTRRIGRILAKLRFKKQRAGGTGRAQYAIVSADLERRLTAYGLLPKQPSEPAPLEDWQLQYAEADYDDQAAQAAVTDPFPLQ